MTKTPTKERIRKAREALKMAEARHRSMNQALVEHDAKRAEIVGHLQALDDAHRAAKQALGRLTLPSTLRDVLVVGAKLPDGKEYATTLAKAARLNQLGLVTMVPGLAGRQKYIKITPAGRDLIA